LRAVVHRPEIAQVYFGIDGYLIGNLTFIFLATSRINALSL
jgi:hypothetical protein